VDELTTVAAAAAGDAGGVDPALLGDFLAAAGAAAGRGRRLTAGQLRHFRDHGRVAAQQGVALRALVDLYLSAAWRLWRHLPAVTNAATDPDGLVRAGESVLRVADDAVAAVIEGYQLARRDLVREQESARREFVDDLLAGRGEVADLLHRALTFGLDLSAPHAVAVVGGTRPYGEGTPLAAAVERAVLGAKGDADALVTSKGGQLVVVFAAPDRAAVDHVAGRVGDTLGPPPWRIALGRPRTGPLGVRAGYDEARDTLDLAGRLGLADRVVDASGLLAYQLLLRDRGTVADLVGSVLGPLAAARGGAGPLLATLAGYLDTGGNAAETARGLHLSVRAVTYRLARIRELTGHDPTDPGQRFSLQVAVLGARLLDWPAHPLT
jgi:hypothetical protein